MEREMLNQFKARFEEEKKNLIYSQNYLNADFKISDEDLMDEVDVSSTELETNMRIRLRNREALYLRKINEALLRISKGSFGECVDCGGSIELRRLHARPTATLCVSCKEEQELRERTHIDGHKHKSLGITIRLTG